MVSNVHTWYEEWWWLFFIVCIAVCDCLPLCWGVYLLCTIVGVPYCCVPYVYLIPQVDTRQDGALLLELYSRDGVGTMISADFYEGIRPAAMGDLDAVAQLLKPLEDKGVLVHRSPEQLRQELKFFTVFEQVR